jgi:hypothetical protein
MVELAAEAPTERLAARYPKAEALLPLDFSAARCFE